LGFAGVEDEDRVFTVRDSQMLAAANDILHRRQLAPEVLLQMTRVVGQAMSRVAASHAALVEPAIDRIIDDPDLDERQVTEATVEIVRKLTETHEPFLTYIWRRHLLAALSQSIMGHDERDTGQTSLCVGFADMVGFTALSQRVTAEELAAIVERFEEVAFQQIPDAGGRIVKIVGDEVMFAHPDPATMAAIALGLAEACEAAEALPSVRVGVAMGPTIAWEGDLYGPTVNLASRLVGFARPGTVVLSEETGQALAEAQRFWLRPITRVRLKGIERTRVWVLRRRPQPDEHDAGDPMSAAASD
jgi:adenylate cyclase